MKFYLIFKQKPGDGEIGQRGPLPGLWVIHLYIYMYNVHQIFNCLSHTLGANLARAQFSLAISRAAHHIDLPHECSCPCIGPWCAHLLHLGWKWFLSQPFSSLSSPLSTSLSLCSGTPPTAGQLRLLEQKHWYYKRVKTFSLVHPTTILFDPPVFLPTVSPPTPRDIDAVTQENSCSTLPCKPLEMIY